MDVLVRSDAFGNAIDESVGYARGEILASAADDVRRMLHGRRLIRERAGELGVDRLYNLTGVTRMFPITEDDRQKLETQISFYAHFAGDAEVIGLRYAGGDAEKHGACFANQVTSGMLGTILTLAYAGSRIVSIVPDGHAHPCIRHAARIAGASHVEVRGLDAGLGELDRARADVVAVTTVTPQKFIFDEKSVRRLISVAKAAGSAVVIDDAHGALRMGYYGQAPVLQLGAVDVAMNSTDKHLLGPRTALLVGEASVIERVRDTLFELGLPAQFAQYVAAMRALAAFDASAIRAAGALADELHAVVAQKLETSAIYSAGTGIALSEEELVRVVLGRGGLDDSPLVPMEMSSLVSMRMLDTTGLMTILVIGMPGASPTLRLMMFPDGHRVGVDAVAAAVDEAISFAASHCTNLAFCREYLIGES
jgi:L-seryl-tRNA(Ser) seleniumtransferase